MKKIILLSVFLTLLFNGCRKQASYTHECKRQEISYQLYGNWKIMCISGGITGYVEIKNFDKLTLNESDTYSVIYSGEVVQCGTFCVEKQAPETYWDFIIRYYMTLNDTFNINPGPSFYPEENMDIILLESDSLIIGDAFLEGIKYYFKRTE